MDALVAITGRDTRPIGRAGEIRWSGRWSDGGRPKRVPYRSAPAVWARPLDVLNCVSVPVVVAVVKVFQHDLMIRLQTYCQEQVAIV